MLVACLLTMYTIVTGPVPDPYAAIYTDGIITVEPEHRWDAGVIFHEIGHHFFYECDADEHPYWMDKPERFADAWAEHRLGYDVDHYEVPWIDAHWMRLWSDARSFWWVRPETALSSPDAP